MDRLGERLSATPEAERPGKVVVAILTDGLENASTHYTTRRVAEMVEHQRTKYGWEFLFLAAGQDAVLSARELAIAEERAVRFEANGPGVRVAFAAMNARVAAERAR